MRPTRSLWRALMLAAFAWFALSPAPVVAQSALGVQAPSYAKLPEAAVAQFKADPQSLLAAYPSGGRAMATMARNLLLSDPTLLGQLLNVAKNANSAQMAAIGGGLAQAARILVVINPELAAQVQLAVAQSGRWGGGRLCGCLERDGDLFNRPNQRDQRADGGAASRSRRFEFFRSAGRLDGSVLEFDAVDRRLRLHDNGKRRRADRLASRPR